MDGNNQLKDMRKIILWSILLFLFGCLKEKENSPYPYLMEMNSLRVEVGLKVIDSTFISYGQKSKISFDKVNKIYNYNINLKLKNDYRHQKKEPSYLQKYIRLNKYSGKPLYEEDIYVSGFYKYSFIEDTDIFETLKYRYVFEDYNDFDIKTKDSIHIKKGWQYIYVYPAEVIGVTSNKPKSEYWGRKSKIIDQNQADSILNSWNIEKR